MKLRLIAGPLMLLCLSSLQTSVSGKDNTIEKFAAELIDNDFSSVAILPKLVIKKKDGSIDTDGDKSTGKLGPRAERYVSDFTKALTKAMKDKGGRVLSPFIADDKIKQAGFGPNDLTDADKIKSLTRKLGVDAIVFAEYGKDRNRNGYVGYKDDDDNELRVSVSKTDQLTLNYLDADLSGGVSDSMKSDVSLSEAAYSGDSWWIREWKGDRLVSRGVFGTAIEEDNKIGVGEEWEVIQFNYMREQKLKHPEDEPDFPYPIKIQVKEGGSYETRKPQKFGNEFVVGLDDGEEYGIFIKNTSDRKVRVAVFIDGVCNINGHEDDDRSKPIHKFPNELDKVNQIYVFDAGEGGRIKYWKSGEGRKMKDIGLFQAKSLKDLDEQEDSFLPNVGMITVVFYADGNDGIDEPDSDPDDFMRSINADADLGTILKKIDPKLAKKGKAKDLGPIIASATYYYRSEKTIRQALNNGRLNNDDPLSDFGETKLVSDYSRR